MARSREGQFEVTIRCRVCGDEHIVVGVAELLRQAISFGGGQEVQETTAGWAGPVMCPSEQRTFECELLMPAHYNESVRKVHIESVADAASDTAAAPGDALAATA